MSGLIETDKGSQKEDKPIPFSIGSHIYESSYTSLITHERLDGTNYMEWSLNAEIKIRGRKHWGYITGTKVAPADTKSEAYEVWDDANSLVKSWPLDAMTKDIRSLFLRLPTVQKIWEAIKRTYTVEKDASKAYQLHCEVISIRQNGGSIISYFGKLLRIWQELDAIDECIMECANDILTYTTKVNSQHVYIFLAGLDSQLDGVRGRILSTKPLPNLHTVYATVCVEANRQGAMFGDKIGEGVVMVTRTTSTSKKDLKCTHCNGTGHIIETCFKLHGYPDWHPKGKKASQTTSQPKGNLTTVLGFNAHSGISLTSNSDWIIDSSATNHMTCDRYRFSHFSSKCPQTSITNANGISSPVMGIGTNIHTKEKIGSGKQSGGLYYLEDGFSSTKNGRAHVANTDLQPQNKTAIWIWHRRLVLSNGEYFKHDLKDFM
ncbi:unnamed protein product [Camellia sinensis]